jgi:hypothetical protein
MKNLQVKTIVISISILVIVPSCKEDTIAPNQSPVNLIQNSSFESNGKSSLQSWWMSDTTFLKLVEDAPKGGGKWSLQLVPGWIPQQFFARTYISDQSGTGIYKLTISMKNQTFGNMWDPYVLLGRLVNNQWTRSKTISTDSTSWQTFSIIDTIFLQPNDTLAVQLSGGAGERAAGSVRFDLVELKRLN